jgi:chemotaxis response regulator CheB
MVAILVTGMSGTGTTAAIRELERRGHRVCESWREGAQSPLRAADFVGIRGLCDPSRTW